MSLESKSDLWKVHVDGVDTNHIVVDYQNIEDGLQQCKHVLAELEQCVADMQQACQLLTEVDGGGAADAFQQTSHEAVRIVEAAQADLGGTVDQVHDTVGQFSEAEMAGARAFWNAQ